MLFHLWSGLPGTFLVETIGKLCGYETDVHVTKEAHRQMISSTLSVDGANISVNFDLHIALIPILDQCPAPAADSAILYRVV